ncbi:hypothetical protein WA026_007170 [Henosepilachna vigintioctopunctata]|uniref:MYND-type domain-containing protein n=1 Tax=Henosepilachna vigintioctopunctata TaxID=420089 RepID=A0AAW1V3Y9_9CUCU
MSEKKELTEVEKQIFASIEKNDSSALKSLLLKVQNVNILDENAMTPLQHAAYKGNREMVQMLIDQGGDVNLCEHQHNYTALHFGGLSGNIEVCIALLLNGAKANVTNTVGRTPSQMAAFVGHYNCAAALNNYVLKEEIDYYVETKHILPKFLAESFHKFVIQVNMHPVKVALNLQNFLGLSGHLSEIHTVLNSMRDREMKKGSEINEVMAFKYHYLSCIVGEIIKLRDRQRDTKKENESEDEKMLDVTELFTRKLLKPSRENTLDFMDSLLREYVREFSFRECTLFRQMLASLTSKDAPSALSVISAAINGQRGFIDSITVCNTCGEEKPAKKCSKCKVVQYCDRNCQRLHWHWHKKACSRLAHDNSNEAEKVTPDANEISAEMQNLLVQN